MKMILAAAVMLFSVSVLAEKPECNNESVAQCGNLPPGQNRVFTVPSPGTVALVGLGIVGLVISRKRSK